MAANTYPRVGKGNFRLFVGGSFAPSGGGISGAAGAVRGVGFTPSYVTTGVYRLTLEDNFKQLVAGKLTFQSLTADNTDVTLDIGDVSPANRTIDIIVKQAGTKANITASGVARRIHFDFELSQSDALGTGTTA